MDSHRGGYRSFFWPVLLIGIGVIWLMKNLGFIPGVNLGFLLRLWPLLLVVIGLDLLFGRRSPGLGALIGLVAAGTIVAAIWLAPSLGWMPETELKRASFREPIAGTESAQVELGLSAGTTTVEALSDSANLFEADLAYVGEVAFDAHGEREKQVSLKQVSGSFNMDLFDLIDRPEELRWEIGLSPQIPLELAVDGGVGKTELDLSELRLTDLTVQADVGEMELSLPPERYQARIDGGVGNCKIYIPGNARVEADIRGSLGSFTIEIDEGASVEARIKGDVGNFTIDVPRETAVRVKADMDVGNISVPGYFDQIRGGGEGPGQTGTWETPDYEKAERKITIDFDGSVGNLTVR